jgi:MFS family permease
MDRRSAYVLLAVFGAGVFLAGLELMVTAVALPSILTNLAGVGSATAWVELRKASWIINAYLLVYILVMPLAGRLADLWGTRRLFMAALAIFVTGSALAGGAQDLDQLIVARVIQALGGGVLVPVGTAAASHLFGGAARPRALGVIGALTFLGMAAGPVVGAVILDSIHADTGLATIGAGPGHPLTAILSPAWRWVFYLNVPVGLVALLLAWAASARWETPHHPGRVDVPGAGLFGFALLTGLVGLTLVGAREVVGGTIDPAIATGVLLVFAALASALAVVRGLRIDQPFLDPRLFASVPFSSAALVSLLTGYGFATAIIGGAVFVDRVLYGGPDEQRLALGTLAGATALGALASGFIVRFVSLRLVTLFGLALSVAGLMAMAGWGSGTPIETVSLALGAYGFGFGLTVTPRSTAAVEAAGHRAFGVASAVVTVARMIGMAVGLAILTAYGSTTIDRLADQIYATPTSYRQFIPQALWDRPLKDPFVVDALESWASREAAGIMVGLFVVAAAVTLVAVPPALALGGRHDRRTRMLQADLPDAEGFDADGREPAEPGLAL